MSTALLRGRSKFRPRPPTANISDRAGYGDRKGAVREGGGWATGGDGDPDQSLIEQTTTARGRCRVSAPNDVRATIYRAIFTS